MARLPTIQSDKAVLRAPQSQVSGNDVQSAFTSLARDLDRVGETLGAAAQEQAQLEGANAVFRDEEGNLRHNTRSNLTTADRAFNRAARTSFLAQVSTDVRSQVTQLAVDANGDVKAFDQSIKAFKSTLVSGQDRLMRGPVGQVIEREGVAARNGLINQQHTRDVKAFEGRITAELKTLDNELGALAHEGGTDTDDYRDRLDSVRALYGELVDNPQFSLSREEADLQIDRMVSRHKAEAIIGRVEVTFNEKGFKAAQEEAEKSFFDPGLNLTTDERRRFVGLALGRIDGIGAQRKALLNQTKNTAKTFIESFDQGLDVDVRQVDDTLKQLAELGDTRTFFRLSRSRAVARNLKSFSGLNDREQADELTRMMGGLPNSVVGQIVSVESGGNPNARNPRSSAFGAGQFIESTWLRLMRQNRPDLTVGRSDAEVLALRGNSALSRQMVGRYAEENISKLEAANVPVNDATIYLSHFLGPAGDGGAIAVLRADPSTPIDQVVASSTIKANPFLKGMTAGDVVRWAAGKMGGAAPRADQAPSGIWTAKRNALSFYKPADLFGGDRNGWLDATTAHFIDQFGENVFEEMGIRLKPTVLRGGEDDPAAGAVGFDVSTFSDEQRQSILRTALKMGFTAVGFGDDGSMQLGTGQARTFGDVPAWARDVMTRDFDPNRRTLNGLRVGGLADPRLVKQMRKEVTADAKRLFNQMKAGFAKNLPPNREDLTLLGSQLALIDDPNLRTEVTDFINDARELQAFGTLAPSQAEAALAQESAAIARDGVAADDVDLVNAKRAMHQRTVKGVENDPIGLAVERGLVPAPAPLDLSSAEGLARSLTARQELARTVAARYNLPAVAITTAQEAEALGRAIDRAPAVEQAEMFGAMAQNLDAETYRATLQKLVAKASPQVLWAGGLMQTDPGVAESVLRGRQLLIANKNFGWKASDVNRGEVDLALPSTLVSPDMQQARQDLTSAIRARYADLSSEAGDTSGELDTERLERATRDVTGGILEFNGEKLIAPTHGMDQRTFDALVGGLSDNDLFGAQTLQGFPVTAADVRRLGRLEGVGDGRYFIRIGNSDAGNYVMAGPLGPFDERSGPFVLDLSGRSVTRDEVDATAIERGVQEFFGGDEAPSVP